jgi:CDGSH-type Zn-finger protein
MASDTADSGADRVVITVRDHGPYRIEGPVTVIDGEGNAFHFEGRVALCRCGQSARKPFCDSTHRSCGWESAPRAGEATPEGTT